MDDIQLCILRLYILVALILLVVAYIVLRILKVKHRCALLFVFFTYLCLGITILAMHHRINTLNLQLSNSIDNEKAYAIENSKLRDTNLVYKLTIEQLEYFQDSLILRIDEFINETTN